MMTNMKSQSEDYRRVEKIIRYMETNFRTQPNLDELAAQVNLSKFHFERLFKRWAGISPQQFVGYLTLEYSKEQLINASTVFDSAFEAGLSGSSRLHDLFVNFEAMSPGEYKNQAAGIEISYGFCPTIFGECLLATTARGICFLGFVYDNDRDDLLHQLYQTYPKAKFIEKSSEIKPSIEKIFSGSSKTGQPFNLFLKGTNFQTKVWRALLTIPEGYLVSYQDVADYIGHPNAVRAVAGAIAVNPISYLIPCHRVINKTGRAHKYRWGSERKKALLGWEAGRLG